MPWIARPLFLALLLTPLLLTGCRKGAPESGFLIRPKANPVLRIAVENQNFLDVTVYAMGDSGASWRLGEVTGNSSHTFTMERRQLAAHPGVRFFVDPLGGARGYLSDPIFLDRAAQVVVHVAPNLELSYVILR